MTETTSEARISGLQKLLSKNDISAILVTNLNNIRYLSGFTGTSAVMLISQQESLFLTDFRYTTQAKNEVETSSILEYKTVNKGILKACKALRLHSLVIESRHIQLANFNSLQKELKPVKVISSAGIVEMLRNIKDKEEIEIIRKAIDISAIGLKETLPLIKDGVEEREIALELEFKMRRLGAEKSAFDFIVASGYRSSMPHGVAGRKKIKRGDLITIDFGCTYRGYNSDITRTFCLGKAGKKENNIYKLVLNAQTEAFNKIKNGISSGEVDKAVRNYFGKNNFAKFFGHGLGHGVGLDIHENPVLSKGAKEKLLEGMVFTIEPGLYIPDKYGVRIEDMVTIKNGKLTILTKAIDKVFEL